MSEKTTQQEHQLTECKSKPSINEAIEAERKKHNLNEQDVAYLRVDLIKQLRREKA